MPLRPTTLVLILACVPVIRAQVVQVSGGTSTLDQASGGQLSLRSQDYSASLGGGTIGGHFYAGGSAVRHFERGELALGTQQIPFDLPTDLFETGHYLTGLGLAYKTASDTSSTYLFAGTTATGFNTPFFTASTVDDPTFILKASDQVGTNTQLSTTLLVAQKPTVLASLAYKSDSAQTQLAATLGLGAGEPYSALSFSAHRRRFDLDASYIAAAVNFRRTNVQTPINSEPDRENLQLVLRITPKIGLTLSRQNFLTPVYQSTANTRSRVTQATTNAQLFGINLAATVSQSSDSTHSNLASFISASRALSPHTDLQLAYLVSRPSASDSSAVFISTVRQTITPRWSISAVTNASSGQVTYGAGAAFLSNLATLSADYEFFYVPARLDDPFERVLIANLQLHLFGRVTLTGTSFVAPDGKLLYTTGGTGLLSRNPAAEPSTLPGSRDAIGRMLLRGRVITITGEPVPGAALLVDHLLIYTDSRGRFELREHKSHQHSLLLQSDRFLEGGLYQTIFAPTVAWSGPIPNPAQENQNQEETFIVRRLPSPQTHR